MIITKLVGGLGNQMFQYAAARSVSLKKHTNFKLDLNHYGYHKLRTYELNNLNIHAEIATPRDIKMIIGVRYRFDRILNKLNLKFNSKKIIKENEDGLYNHDLFTTNGDIYLDGYWQSEKYFKDIRSELLKDFKYNRTFSDVLNKYLDEVKNSNSISLHIRRGDYVTNANTNSVHGVCELSYYKDAMNYFKEKIETPKFFIISDDIEWCKNNLDLEQSHMFIDKTELAYEDLEIMKNCSHNIIANSSFSWWGAWLNENPDKIIIAPKKWYNNLFYQDKTKDLIPDSWIKL